MSTNRRTKPADGRKSQSSIRSQVCVSSSSKGFRSPERMCRSSTRFGSGVSESAAIAVRLHPNRAGCSDAQPEASAALQEILNGFRGLADAMVVLHQRETDVPFSQRPETDAG